MKKTLSFIMALIICLSLIGCGSSADDKLPLEQEPSLLPSETPAAPVPEAPSSPFSALDEEYTVDLPIYTLSTFYSSLGDDTYTYSNVVHDDEGRVISWEKQENSHASNGYTAEYNEDGLLSSLTYHHSLYGYTEVYTYNEAGLLTEKTETDPDDAEYYLTRTYAYDENGMLSGGRTMSSSDFYDGGIDEYSYELDEQGRIIKESDYSVDMDYLNENSYEYNELGQMIESHESTIDEGILKSIYDTNFDYNAYGFPIYAHIDNSFDYKGDTVKWESSSTYAATGSITVNSADDDILKPVSAWLSYEEENILPAADTVLSSITLTSAGNGTYRYALPAEEADTPEYSIFGRMQGLNSFSVIDISAYSAQDCANQFLWRYEAVLTQLLGLETAELNGRIVVKDGNFSLATLSIEFADGAYSLVVSIN